MNGSGRATRYEARGSLTTSLRRCAAALCAGLAVACQPAAPVPVEQLEMRLALGPDGSLEVEESYRARVSGDRFELRRPATRYDAIGGVVATLDGAEAPRGDGAGAAQVDTNDGLNVTWRLPAPDGTHDFGLRYRVAGAVAVRGSHAAVSWMVLPPRHPYDVASAAVTMTLRAPTQLSAEPYMAEAGWSVAADGTIVSARSAGRIAPGQTATLVVPFLVDPRELPEPAWQLHEARARDLMPAFVSGGVFILIVAAGVLVMVRAQYPRRRDPAPDPARAAVARGLRMAGFVTVVFGIVLLPVTEWTLGQYDIWPHAIPASIIASGVAFAIFGARSQI